MFSAILLFLVLGAVPRNSVLGASAASTSTGENARVTTRLTLVHRLNLLVGDRLAEL